MADKRPQPTDTLVKRLQRVAKWFDEFNCDVPVVKVAMQARANTCWQAAARLEALEAECGEDAEYVASMANFARQAGSTGRGR